FVHAGQADFLTRAAPAPHGILLANPPYGVRLADQENLAVLYPKWGDALKQRFAGWTAYFFTGDLALPKLIHLKVRRKVPLMNGAIECRLFEFPMVAGRPADAKI
ncbi:MAG: class I SAM-dependent RNA methyltransferase, partial [Burkholderiales bacterium]|nr:class I SAM-dependent RNA methyltransferase [Burkholderiales bacterium]